MNEANVNSRLRRLEGVVPCMYLDSRGLVTWGVGHQGSLDEALRGAWCDKDGTMATPEEVAKEYEFVKTLMKDRTPEYYEAWTRLRMKDDAINDQLILDIEDKERELKARLPQWQTYPEPAQEALFDMAYNLGVAGLLKYHKLLHSCQVGDWESAAAQCYRHGPSQARNDETAGLFRQCVA